jgi:ribosome-binding protein aMBF1 (putative translation factor)
MCVVIMAVGAELHVCRRCRWIRSEVQVHQNSFGVVHPEQAVFAC